uniref:Uncharacterized protein n=1 Tax=Sphaerodactylus townsendi TaxID=933632 RepID=A0ACB8F0J6_9SAUR
MEAPLPQAALGQGKPASAQRHARRLAQQVAAKQQEKRKRQTEIENKRRQLEDDRRQLQHLKSKTLRERWLLEGAPSSTAEEGEALKKQMELDDLKAKELEGCIQSWANPLTYVAECGTGGQGGGSRTGFYANRRKKTSCPEMIRHTGESDLGALRRAWATKNSVRRAGRWHIERLSWDMELLRAWDVARAEEELTLRREIECLQAQQRTVTDLGNPRQVADSMPTQLPLPLGTPQQAARPMDRPPQRRDLKARFNGKVESLPYFL